MQHLKYLIVHFFVMRHFDKKEEIAPVLMCVMVQLNNKSRMRHGKTILNVFYLGSGDSKRLKTSKIS